MNNYLFLGIPIFGYLGYKTYQYTKTKLYEYIFEEVKKDLDKRMRSEEKDELFKPHEKCKSAIIKFNHGGKSHNIFIPYDRSKSTSMLSRRVYLFRDGNKIELIQKPGIPFLICAADLGGEKIIVEDLSGEIKKTFLETEIPRYL